MSSSLSRRDLLRVATATGLAAASAATAQALPQLPRPRVIPGWVMGRLTGAEAVVETLMAECVECVFGIPGAQQNELWDTLKTKHMNYLLVTHEFSAACMADGYARSTGKPGVLCIVPGPGLTNSLSGIGEALLDSVPMVCIVGDVAQGDCAHAFQVHDLPQVGILEKVTKHVFSTRQVGDIPTAIREAFRLARAGEPGPVGVVIPYTQLIETAHFQSGPLEPFGLPFNDELFQRALALLSNRRLQVGIYAGMGCMDYAPALTQLAELLQAPVATTISGKGVISEDHPLSVGWGYGPQGRAAAETAFRHVDVVLALGVKYSEVSTGYYSQPQTRHLIHVDANPLNLGRNMRTDVCMNADTGVFIGHVLAQADCVRRGANQHLCTQIARAKEHERRAWCQQYAQCGADPMAFILALRRCTCPDALAFVDVTCSQYWATEAFATSQPRTFFNPSNNQAMGWSIPAALGAQKVHPGRQVVTITGDGCLLMSAMEISTAARERLPVKFFVLDDQTYHYMQLLQQPAYLRTTATILTRLDYRALAQGWGVAYHEILRTDDLEPCIRGALQHEGPVLVRVVTDYRRRPIRWIDAARQRYTNNLTPAQQMRFAARIGSRALELPRRRVND